ncbi:hypothetical protein ACQU0X_25690 [Pseudovibrio ascidiaceicola]|uniref:hypothetical protein n=1 Tax=Pseudovibrio ascidiaceicola TaxID=285279 RepID=UPI003D3684AD
MTQEDFERLVNALAETAISFKKCGLYIWGGASEDQTQERSSFLIDILLQEHFRDGRPEWATDEFINRSSAKLASRIETMRDMVEREFQRSLIAT